MGGPGGRDGSRVEARTQEAGACRSPAGGGITARARAGTATAEPHLGGGAHQPRPLSWVGRVTEALELLAVDLGAAVSRPVGTAHGDRKWDRPLPLKAQPPPGPAASLLVTPDPHSPARANSCPSQSLQRLLDKPVPGAWASLTTTLAEPPPSAPREVPTVTAGQTTQRDTRRSPT